MRSGRADDCDTAMPFVGHLLIGLGGNRGLAFHGSALLTVNARRSIGWLALVEHLEFLFLQVCDSAALLVAHHDGYQNAIGG